MYKTYSTSKSKKYYFNNTIYLTKLEVHKSNAFQIHKKALISIKTSTEFFITKSYIQKAIGGIFFYD